jgi:4'-phosphopantetheinyl transferase
MLIHDRRACELWYVKTADVAAPSLVARCEALLTAEEHERRGKFVFEKNRHEYLVTRALAQWTLARWTKRRPGEVTFVRTEYGRPLLHPPSDVRFNLTNTIHLVACLVGAGRELGVDAEPIARADDILGIADTVFLAGELAALGRPAPGERRRRAVELWTYKEAYMKARGMGMSIPPQKFQIVHRDGLPKLDLSLLGDDDEGRWELRAHEVEGHIVSTCVERIDGKPAAIEVQKANLGELMARSGA